MAKYPDRRSATIPALAAAQRLHGWCSPEAIAQVAAVMRLTPGYVVAVATFYDQLDTRPVGRHRVYVCTNISCSLRGGDELLDALEHELGDDPDVHVRHFECLGACDIAPMASIDGVYVGPIDARGGARSWPSRSARARPPLPDKQILRRASTDPTANTREFPRPGAIPCPAGGAGRRHPRPPARAGHVRRADAGRPARSLRAARGPMSEHILFHDIDEPGLNTLEVYERRGGYESLRKALALQPQQITDELLASNVRGRGGAGFAMGRKVSFMPAGQMDKYLVCNADESEPGTFKDRELITKTPHTLIEGIIIAAFAAGATRSFIYIRGEYQQQADILDAALRGGLRGRLPGREHPRLRLRPSASSCTAARAPTSAARRPRCSTRSRASAATRA